MTTFRTDRGLVVDSHLTNEAAIAVLARCPGDFARKLLAVHNSIYGAHGIFRGRRYGHTRHLTHNQLAWVHKLALEQLAREEAASRPTPAARPVVAVADDFTAVQQIFALAKSRLKRPRVRFKVAGHKVELRLAGSKSSYPGCINVTDGRKFGNNTWYGRIHTDGRFEASRVCTGEVLDFLRAFGADPAAVANRYGQACGCCCFCGKDLTHAHLGYGPDCAQNWGLPWTLKLASGAAAADVPADVFPYEDPCPVADDGTPVELDSAVAVGPVGMDEDCPEMDDEWTE